MYLKLSSFYISFTFIRHFLQPAEQDDYDGVEKVESVQNYSDIDEVIDR